MSSGGPAQSIANLAKGQDRGNSVAIQVSSLKSKLQTSLTLVSPNQKNSNLNLTLAFQILRR